MSKVYPFSAIVGQDALKQALMIAAVDPAIGGVMVFGDRVHGRPGPGWSAAIDPQGDRLPLQLRPGSATGLRRRLQPSRGFIRRG